MSFDLVKLMETIDLLQSEEIPEPVMEVEQSTVHPLLQAMQELKEEQELEEYNIRKTKKFIQRAHDQEQGQMYGNMPYSSHPKQVANLGKKFFGSKFNDEAVKVALLHDILEDTPYTPEQLAKKGFSKEVIEAVQLLTKNKALTYADNIRAIINSGNPLAMMVKYCDNYMNYTGDKSHWTADRAAASQKKYLASLNMLGDVLGIKKHVGEEPVEEEIAYHGTTDDIAEFYPLTHFGTEKAAKDRMTYKKIKDGKIYKVDLNIKNPLTIKDFPGIHYDRLYAFELKNKKLISQEEMEAITFIQDKAELRKALLAKLKELGIDGFVYKNRYEDKGNLSYVIVDPSQVKVLSVEPAAEEVTEASPDTLEGSFTPDLVESKTWLAEMLAKGLKGKNAGTIYVLGSWYGNMGIFLQQAGVQFDKLVLVEPDEEALMRSKDLLQQIGDEGKLILIHQKAEDAVYEKPGVVINTSCNETGPVFLTKLPDNMLCLLQARNNNENTLFPTEDEEDFIDYFPLETVYYTGKKHLEDPEVNYVRYMKIGRTGKKLDETISTGQGGGSAGVGGGQMVGGPTTYEQEYGMFKSKGPRRIMAMTEALDSSYPYRNSKQNPGKDFYFDTEDGQEYKVEFDSIWGDDVTVGFAARGQGDEHKIGLTGTGNSRKIFGTVIKIVKDYITKANPEIIVFSANNSEPSRVRLYNMLASQVNKELPNYNFTDAFSNGGFTTYYLTRDGAKIPTSAKVKAKAGKALDKVFEDSNTVTLFNLYDGAWPDDDERIWNYVSDNDFDIPFEVNTIQPFVLDQILCDQYGVDDIEDLFRKMQPEQEATIEDYQNDPGLSNHIIVLHGSQILDGNHRALAAVLTNKPIKYIDISDEEE